MKQCKKEVGAQTNVVLLSLLKKLEHNFREINARMAYLGVYMNDLEVNELVAKAVKFARNKIV